MAYCLVGWYVERHGYFHSSGSRSAGSAVGLGPQGKGTVEDFQQARLVWQLLVYIIIIIFHMLYPSRCRLLD